MTDAEKYLSEIPEGFSALLKLEGGEANQNQARAEHLAAVLSGMQKIAYLLAAADAGQELGERVKPNKSMRDGYSLRCGVPQPGSYAIPMDPGIGNHSLLGTNPLLDRVQAIFAAVAGQDDAALHALLPSALYVKALREIQKFLPREQDGIRLSLGTRSQPVPATLVYKSARFIKEKLKPLAAEDAVMTVTGELQSIDFSARQVTIIYPPTRKEIVCTYLPDIEETILEARKEPIQVTGKFVLDDDGNPQKLIDVTRIEPLDLSPLVFSELDSLPVRFREPLELVPELDDETQQYLCVTCSQLNLHAFALNREQLYDEVQEQLAMLWQEYARADDTELAEDAAALKAVILTMMEDAGDAKTQG